jgi:hypothetical protein
MGREEIDRKFDIEYFRDYPAPVMEAIQRDHFTIINHTIPFFGPMLYFMIRALGAEQVLEIGMAEGYTSYYMAQAIKDNATRYDMKGNRYYGIDIAQVERTAEALESKGLPATCLWLDSLELPGPLAGITFDLVFQDGNHDKEHVVKEFETMYPQLKGDGKGYWIAHDCFGDPDRNAVHGVNEIIRLIKEGVYNMEYCRLWDIYGLAIFRKMDK